MNPQTNQTKWTCDGVPKDGRQYPDCTGPHPLCDNDSTQCPICGLPKQAVVSPQTKSGVKSVMVALITAFAGLAAVGGYYAINSGLLVTYSSRFYCGVQPDASQGGDVYTVMYRHDKGKKPWLKMVSTLGDDWTPNKRCEEIASRLEIFRKDGLTQISYRTDPNTPNQYVICAKTKVSGEGCPLLLTLKPGSDPYETIKKMADALLGDGDGVVQSSKGASPLSSFSRSSPAIDLTNHLAAEDLQAGSAGAGR